MIEVDLLPSWYWPLRKKFQPPADACAEFNSAVAETSLRQLGTSHPVWTLRDYHSPNLLWLPERKGLRRVGLIDTQDCVMGNPAYDLVSMLQDARVDIDSGFADELFEYYCGLRSSTGNIQPCRLQPGTSPSSAPSGPPRSSASLRACSSVTASLPISGTCPGFHVISHAISSHPALAAIERLA